MMPLSLCTCLIQKEGIEIISAQLRCWQIQVKHSACTHTAPQTRSLCGTLSTSGSKTSRSCSEFGSYTDHVSRIYRSYREKSYSVFQSRLDLAGWLFFFKFISVCNTPGFHNISLSSDQTTKCWEELPFRVDFNHFPAIASDTQKSTDCIILLAITSIVHSKQRNTNVLFI